jgi:Multiubiquitin
MTHPETAPPAHDDPQHDHDHRGEVVVTVNRKPVTLLSHRVTGLQIKRAAIAQGVEIQEDFLLTLEAFHGHPARSVADDELITVTKHSTFTANDGDDDS